MATGFRDLGMGELGAEKKYYSAATEMPGIVEAITKVPKAYVAKEFIAPYIDPAVNWISKTLGVAPPTIKPVGSNPLSVSPQLNTTPSIGADEDHALSNPWMK